MMSAVSAPLSIPVDERLPSAARMVTAAVLPADDDETAAML